MAKFLNKKEQVYDLKLTSYGHYLLSIGSFKPVYYTLMDDNILYDKRYAAAHYTKVGAVTALSNTDIVGEQQNEIHQRIKHETPYLETVVHFDDVERLLITSDGTDATEDLTGTEYDSLHEAADGSSRRWFALDVLPVKLRPAVDRFRMNSTIGDARFMGKSQTMPAWKLIMLNGAIHSSSYHDRLNNEDVPQIDITLDYTKRIQDPTTTIDPETVFDTRRSIGTFVDDKVISLETQDAMAYLEEVNTELLTKNFDIEVFEVVPGAAIVKSTAHVAFVEAVPNVGSYYDKKITLYDFAKEKEIYIATAKTPFTTEYRDDCVLGNSTTRLTAEMYIDGVTSPRDLAKSFDGLLDFLVRNDLIAITSFRMGATCILTQGKAGAEGDTEITTDLNSAQVRFNVRTYPGTSTPRDGPHRFGGGEDLPPALERKYFQKTLDQLSNDVMIYSRPPEREEITYTSGSVEYYFDILTDADVNKEIACRGSEVWNKTSYYVDLDFDCHGEDEHALYYDIYGKVTEPELCLD